MVQLARLDGVGRSEAERVQDGDALLGEGGHPHGAGFSGDAGADVGRDVGVLDLGVLHGAVGAEHDPGGDEGPREGVVRAGFDARVNGREGGAFGIEEFLEVKAVSGWND